MHGGPLQFKRTAAPAPSTSLPSHTSNRNQGTGTKNVIYVPNTLLCILLQLPIIFTSHKTEPGSGKARTRLAPGLPNGARQIVRRGPERCTQGFCESSRDLISSCSAVAPRVHGPFVTGASLLAHTRNNCRAGICRPSDKACKCIQHIELGSGAIWSLECHSRFTVLELPWQK